MDPEVGPHGDAGLPGHRHHRVGVEAQQRADGAWGGDTPQYHKPAWSTCFAILFLKQATRRLDVASTDRR